MQFRYDIQGIRAMAVLSVMIFHANANWLPAGFLGVDLFFVISGFIVTNLIIRNESTFNWKQFYIERIKRILPAYIILLIIITLIAAILFITPDFTYYHNSLLSALKFSSNHYFARFGDYFAPSVNELPLLHTWSLSLEMQFYFLLPLMLFILPKRYKISLLFLIGFILLTWSEYSIAYKNSSVYFSLFSRIPEFLAGAILALYLKDKKTIQEKTANILSTVGMCIILGAFFLIPERHYPGYLSLIPIIGLTLLISAQSSFINRILAHPVLVWIGAISYSLYLWHWPILAFIRYFTEQYELTLSAIISYFIISIILGWISYKYIEQPFRRLKNHKAILYVFFLLIIFSIVSVASLKMNKVLSPVEIGKYIKFGGVDNICHGQLLNSCVRGETKEKVDALVIGDSHAAQLNQFFDEIGTSNHLQFDVITASSCVPIKGFDIERISDWAHNACYNQISAVEKRLYLQDTLIIAAYWSYQLSSQEFQIALANFLDNTHKHYKKIIIMAQLPNFTNNVKRTHRFNALGFNPINHVTNEWRTANQTLEKIIQNYPNIELFDITNNALFHNAPFYKESLFYDDSHHINDLGIELYRKEAEHKFIDLLNKDKK